MARLHYLQHVAFEGLGTIRRWFDAAGYQITSTQFFDSVTLPSPESIDFLVIMGGPMSVNDERSCPWLIAEMDFIGQCIQAGKPTLGICLGAQLIAKAAGASVRPGATREIGWFPIRGIDPQRASAFRFPDSVNVFHWHSETFDLPAGAMLLANSEVCENQAFQLGQSVIGLQFHLETTPQSARDLVLNCSSELVPSPFVQSAETILSAPMENYRTVNRLMDDVLAFLSESAANLSH